MSRIEWVPKGFVALHEQQKFTALDGTVKRQLGRGLPRCSTAKLSLDRATHQLRCNTTLDCH